MRKTKLRARALLDRWFAVIAVALLILSAGAAYASYRSYTTESTEIETREVASWKSTGSFDHRATVLYGSEPYKTGTVLRNRSFYYRRVTPVLDGAFKYRSWASNGSDLRINSSTKLRVHSISKDIDGNVTEYWHTERHLTTKRERGIESNETVRVPFSANISRAAINARHYNRKLDTPPAKTKAILIATVHVRGDRNGQRVNQTRTYEMPITIKEGIYEVEDPGTVTKSDVKTRRVVSTVEPGSFDRVVLPMIALLGLAGLAALAVARRKGVIEVTDREQEMLTYQNERSEYDEWITTAKLPERTLAEPLVEVNSLKGLVDVAIDTNGRVIEDPQVGKCVVFDEDFTCVYFMPHLGDTPPSADLDDLRPADVDGDATPTKTIEDSDDLVNSVTADDDEPSEAGDDQSADLGIDDSRDDAEDTEPRTAARTADTTTGEASLANDEAAGRTTATTDPAAKMTGPSTAAADSESTGGADEKAEPTPGEEETGPDERGPNADGTDDPPTSAGDAPDASATDEGRHMTSTTDGGSPDPDDSVADGARDWVFEDAEEGSMARKDTDEVQREVTDREASADRSTASDEEQEDITSLTGWEFTGTVPESDVSDDRDATDDSQSPFVYDPEAEVEDEPGRGRDSVTSDATVYDPVESVSDEVEAAILQAESETDESGDESPFVTSAGTDTGTTTVGEAADDAVEASIAEAEDQLDELRTADDDTFDASADQSGFEDEDDDEFGFGADETPGAGDSDDLPDAPVFDDETDEFDFGADDDADEGDEDDDFVFGDEKPVDDGESVGDFDFGKGDTATEPTDDADDADDEFVFGATADPDDPTDDGDPTDDFVFGDDAGTDDSADGFGSTGFQSLAAETGRTETGGDESEVTGDDASDGTTSDTDDDDDSFVFPADGDD
jgi:hypothetical protein